MAENNRKIAKNTIYVYFRTIAVLLVSLYTSRIVLEALGAEDYGIYSVVGGIIALLGFFQAAQSKATSRFITYELGANGMGDSLRKVFGASLSIHLLTALFAIIICETVGLWIIENWAKIPTDRHTAAIAVYQFSIVIFCIHLIRIPYDAVVIAHEEMSVFAYFSIFEVALQLGVAFCVKYAHTDSLILYSVLLSASTFCIFMLYFVYVRHHYPLYRTHLHWDSRLCKQMMTFSGWTLMGAGANAGTQQGMNLMMNNFVGLVANAAMGIASQVNLAVNKFISGFATAFTPQIIKLYAKKEKDELITLICRCSKFSFALCYIMVLPLICNMPIVLHLWLGDNVPEYTSGFCCMILACTVIDATSGVFGTVVTASGKIRNYQILISLSFLLDLACSYCMFIIGINPVLIFSSRILTRGVINMYIGTFMVGKRLNISQSIFYRKIVSRVVATILLTGVPAYFLVVNTNGWTCFASTCLFSVLSTGFCLLYILMTHSERKKFIQLVTTKIRCRLKN